jgi:hypothetical protein
VGRREASTRSERVAATHPHTPGGRKNSSPLGFPEPGGGLLYQTLRSGDLAELPPVDLIGMATFRPFPQSKSGCEFATVAIVSRTICDCC